MPEALDEQVFPQGTFPSSRGGQVELADLRGTRATVLVFLSTECPISNAYIPVLNRLMADFTDQEVAVVGIYSHASQSLTAIAAHERDFEIGFPVLKDPGAHLADQLEITICPEALLFDAEGKLRYRGRIDDRYRRRAAAAVEVKQADLEMALRQMLDGKTVSGSRTTPVGCVLPRARPRPNDDDSTPHAVTWCRQVSRIVAKNCLECHRPGAIGPFSLETYEQALDWAADIQQVTAEKTMPPWKAVPGHGEFARTRSLSAEDIATLEAWVTDGCPLGDEAELAEPPKFPDGWLAGEPDLILEPSEDYELAADGGDVYRCFVFPTDFDRDRYIVGLEVLPGNRRIVHHVIAFVDTTGRSEVLDQEDPGPGYRTSQGFPGFLPAGGLGGWAPGNTQAHLPEGMAKVLPRGARVVMQVHYHKTGKRERDRTRLGLYASRVQVTRAVRALPLMPKGGPLSGMRIPAGEANYEIRGSFTMPADALALQVTPHMHLLGKDMRVDATLPDGRVEPLVYVQGWDFNWQESYQYRQPVVLPRGTRLELVAHYDNSADNPRNPRHPPEEVHWGEQTTDEMCIAFIEVAPRAEVASESELKAPDPMDGLLFLLRGRLESIFSKSESEKNPLQR